MSSDSLPLLDLYSLGLSQFLPSLFLGELLGHWQWVVLDLRFESMILRELLLSLLYDLLCLGNSRMRLLTQLLQISIYSGFHIVASEFARASCMRTETALLIILGALIGLKLLGG